MGEPSIPVSAIRKAIADDLWAERSAKRQFQDANFDERERARESLVMNLEWITGTPIRRRPR
jgi:hypothetical protein